MLRFAFKWIPTYVGMTFKKFNRTVMTIVPFVLRSLKIEKSNESDIPHINSLKEINWDLVE